MLSKQEVQEHRTWEDVASQFRRQWLKTNHPPSHIVFGETYRELLEEIAACLGDGPCVLKTDLWNEGIEIDRNLAPLVHKTLTSMRLVGVDISRHACESAQVTKHYQLDVVRATLLASPFRQVFDLVIDPSTIDHIPERLGMSWITSEGSLLKKDGIILMVFDNRLNLVAEMFHRLVTRKIYPERTITPSHVRMQLAKLGFVVVREHGLFSLSLAHALFFPSSFLHSQQPWVSLGRLLSRMKILFVLKRVESSRNWRFFSFLAPQYVIVARKSGTRQV